MMKMILLAGAALIATPVMAQDTTGAPVGAQTPDATQIAPAPAPAPAPADGQVTPAPAPAPQGDVSAATDGQGAKVAAIVSTEFPTYDADKSGDLNATEFASWMDALKKASDPSFDATKPDSKAWVDQAFAAADADKSKAVSQAELTSFLTTGAG